MATYDFSKIQNTPGKAGAYGFVNGLPVLMASGVDNYLQQLGGGGGKVQGVAHTNLDDEIGWDLGSASGFVVNGAAIAGLGKSVTTNGEDGSTTVTYEGDFNKAAQQVGLNPAAYSSQEALYEAINNQLKDTYIIGGAKREGIGATGAGNNVQAVYRREGDALVPVSQATAYEGVINPPSTSGFKKFAANIAPIAGIALMATGAGAALGGAILGAGSSAAAAGALGGGLIGGGLSAAAGGNVLTGASLGALGGFTQAGGFNGIGNTLSNTFSEITGLDPSTVSSAFSSANDIANAEFAAADALTMANNGVGTAAIQQNLIASGVDSLTAATLAQNAVMPGASLASLSESIAGTPTYSGLGTSGTPQATAADRAISQGVRTGANNLLNSVGVAAGSLLGGVAGAIPGAVSGLYGARQDQKAYEEYANRLTTQTNAYNQALQDQVAGFAGNVTGAAGSAGNMLTGTARTQAGNLTNAVGGFTGEATNVAEQQANALTGLAGRLAPSMQFNPVGMTTRFGSTTTPQYDANGKLTGFGYTVASDIAAQRDRLLGLSNQALPTTTDIGQATTNYYNELQALQNPQREQQLAALRAQLQTTGRGGLAFGATTGASGNALAATNPELAAYYNALAQQQSQQALTAQDVAQQRLNQQVALSRGLFTDAQTLEGAGQQAMTIGANLGQTAQQAAAQAAQTQLQAQQAAMAQRISAQLQAAGLDAAAATNAAQLQVQSATSAAQMQVQAAINAANLQASAAQQAATSNVSSAQLGAKLQATGQLGYNAAVQEGLLGITPAAGSLLQAGGNYLTQNAGGLLSSAGNYLFGSSSPTPANFGYNQFQPDFGGFDLNSTTTPGLWQDLSFA